MSRSRGAFTLIELLVVISIIALLISILLPSLGRAKMMAQTAQCATQVRGVMLGMDLSAADHRGYYPTADRGSATPNDAMPQPANWPAAQSPIRYDDYLITRDYTPFNQFMCPAADFIPNDTHYTYGGRQVFFKSPRQYGLATYGVAGMVFGQPADTSRPVPRRTSQIASPAQSVATGDSDPGYYLAARAYDASNVSANNVWRVAGTTSASWTGVAAVRHAEGGNYAFLDCHAAFYLQADITHIDHDERKSWWRY